MTSPGSILRIISGRGEDGVTVHEAAEHLQITDDQARKLLRKLWVDHELWRHTGKNGVMYTQNGTPLKRELRWLKL